MFPGNVNPKKLMKALQDAQEKVAAEIAALRCEGTAGGGVVAATVDGNKNLIALTISKEVVEDGDPAMIADLVIAAVNEAAGKAETAGAKKQQELASMFGLPPGLGF